MEGASDPNGGQMLLGNLVPWDQNILGKCVWGTHYPRNMCPRDTS